MDDRRKMPLNIRAKQFMPFSALEGFEEALRKKEIEHENNFKKPSSGMTKHQMNYFLNSCISKNTTNIYLKYENETGIYTFIGNPKDIHLNEESILIGKKEIKYLNILEMRILQ